MMMTTFVMWEHYIGDRGGGCEDTGSAVLICHSVSAAQGHTEWGGGSIYDSLCLIWLVYSPRREINRLNKAEEDWSVQESVQMLQTLEYFISKSFVMNMLSSSIKLLINPKDNIKWCFYLKIEKYTSTCTIVF